jgi:predicted anti-sigma-YlaC factor YlaD
MFCDEVLELVDAIAAGDVAADARVSAHLDSCTGCRAALDAARRIDRLLKDRAAPAAPAHFTNRIMGRIRRDRWRRDQFLDVGFNVAVGFVLLGVFAILWVVLSQSGFGPVSRDAFGLLNSAAVDFLRRAAATLPLYMGALAVVAATVGIWWWAERDAAP